MKAWQWLVTLIKRKSKTGKPRTAKPRTAAQKAADSANGRKAAAAAKAKRKHTAPGPRSGAVAKPRKAGSPKPATVAA